MNTTSYAYELRVQGSASEVTRAAFDDVDVSVAVGQTVLRTGVIDSAALYGLIGRIESLGLVLMNVQAIDGASDGPAVPEWDFGTGRHRGDGHHPWPVGAAGPGADSTCQGLEEDQPKGNPEDDRDR